jgi:putative transposase
VYDEDQAVRAEYRAMSADRVAAAWQNQRCGSDRIPIVRQWMLWVPRSGAHWFGLPKGYGKSKTVHRRFSRWYRAGVREHVFDVLTADRDNQDLMLDSTIVRAHQQATSGKKGPRIRRWGVPEAE